jgi:ABC-type transporter lipoprotein component MlaA
LLFIDVLFSCIIAYFTSISGLWGAGYGLDISLPVAMVGSKTCRDGFVHVPSTPDAIIGVSPEQVKIYKLSDYEIAADKSNDF